MENEKTLQPGRELDIRIAEAIQGIKVYKTTNDWARDGSRTYPHNSPVPVIVLDPPSGRHSVPHYSADISAAWLVVDHLRDDEPEEVFSDFALAVFSVLRTFYGHILRGYEDTISPLDAFLAMRRSDICFIICLAALKALEPQS